MSNVKQYRKKPVVIEAVLYDGTNAQEIENWATSEEYERLIAMSETGELHIFTLEGEMNVSRS